MKSVKKTLLVIASLLLGIFGVNVTASAATDFGSQFLTNVTLTNDLGQNVLDSNIEVQDLKDYRLSYDFAYPDTVKPGDTMTVELPSVLKVSQLSDFDIKNGDGVVVATASFEEGSHKLRLTFTDRATEKQNNRGSFFISTKWDQTASGVTDGPVNVELPVKGTIERHRVLQKGVKYDGTEFSKFGEMDPKNPTIINYELQLNYNGFGALMENIVGGDILGEGLDYIEGSFEFVMRKNGQEFVVDSSRYTVTFADDNRSFGFTMDKVLPEEELLIRYKTKVTDGNKAAEYDNKAWIRYDANQIGLTVDKKTKNTVGGGSSVGELPPAQEPKEPTQPVQPTPNVPEQPVDPEVNESNGTGTVAEPEVDETDTPEVSIDENNDNVTNSVQETFPDKTNDVTVTTESNKDAVDSKSDKPKQNKQKVMKNTHAADTKNKVSMEKQTQAKSDKKDLPETGYEQSKFTAVVGMILLALTIGFVLYRKR